MFQSENEIDRQAAAEALAMSRSHRSSRGIDVVDRVYKIAGVGRVTGTNPTFPITIGFTEKSFKENREQRKAARKVRIAAAQSYVEPK